MIEYYPENHEEDKYADVEAYFGKKKEQIIFKSIHKITNTKNFCESLEEIDMLIIHAFSMDSNPRFRIATTPDHDPKQKRKIRLKLKFLLKKIDFCLLRNKSKKLGLLFNLINDEMVEFMSNFLEKKRFFFFFNNLIFFFFIFFFFFTI